MILGEETPDKDRLNWEGERAVLESAIQEEYTELPPYHEIKSRLDELNLPGLAILSDKIIGRNGPLSSLFDMTHQDEGLYLIRHKGGVTRELISIVEGLRANGTCGLSLKIKINKDLFDTISFLSGRKFIRSGSFGNHTIEHERGHQRALNNLLGETERGISYTTAVELHEAYAQNCQADEYAHILGTKPSISSRDPLIRHAENVFDPRSPYSKVSAEGIDSKKTAYSHVSIGAMRELGVPEEKIAEAVAKHGEWQDSVGYASIEAYLKGIPLDVRRELWQNNRLRWHLEMVRGVRALREMVLNDELNLPESAYRNPK